MIETILLDSGPLGLVTNPKSNPESLECKAWLQGRLDNGCRVIIPAIVDYEVRRELIRAGKTAGLRRLDQLCEALELLSISNSVLRQAAELWAQARSAGRQTATNNVLDADMILAAQLLSLDSESAVIATSNVGHLSYFVPAKLWAEIV